MPIRRVHCRSLRAPGAAISLCLFGWLPTLAPMLAGELIRDRVPWKSPFSRVSDVLFVSNACLLDGAIAATICATALCGKIFAAPSVLVDKWFDGMLSDAGAAILLTPFLLLGGLILLSCRLLASSRASF